jgi:hypothetical protein
MTPFTGNKCLLFNERKVNKKIFDTTAKEKVQCDLSLLKIADSFYAIKCAIGKTGGYRTASGSERIKHSTSVITNKVLKVQPKTIQRSPDLFDQLSWMAGRKHHRAEPAR